MDESTKPMPIGKGIITTLIVIVAVVIIVALCTLAGIPMWVLFLGLCAWMAMGPDVTYKGVTRIWLGAALGLLIGFLMPLAAAGEIWALVITVVLLLSLLFCMTTNRLPILFNMSTGIFTTVATIGFGVEPQAFISCAVGYLVIGLLPVLIVTQMAKKKEQATQEEPALD